MRLPSPLVWAAWADHAPKALNAPPRDGFVALRIGQSRISPPESGLAFFESSQLKGSHMTSDGIFHLVHVDGFSHFVTSMTAPVASGWSRCRVGLAPTGKRRLFTAHANCRLMQRSKP